MATIKKGTKKTKKELPENAVEIIENGQVKIVSKTWLAFLKATKNPGKILDMRAVLK